RVARGVARSTGGSRAGPSDPAADGRGVTVAADRVNRWVWVGILILALLWLGPLPALSRTAFSAHMLLHLGVVALAAPVLALGLVRSGRRLRTGERFVTAAVLIFSLEMLVVWGWHLPALHEAAARQVGLFVREQLAFVLCGAAVCWLAWSVRRRTELVVALLGSALTLMPLTILGVLLLLAPRLLYLAELCMGLYGFPELDDQRPGGVLMA